MLAFGFLCLILGVMAGTLIGLSIGWGISFRESQEVLDND